VGASHGQDPKDTEPKVGAAVQTFIDCVIDFDKKSRTFEAII
jgi:hypothetical protein